MRYRIQVHGRFHYYATLEAAKEVCERVFARLGIVLGIEEVA